MGTSNKGIKQITGTETDLLFHSSHLKIELALPAGFLELESPILKTDITIEPHT